MKAIQFPLVKITLFFIFGLLLAYVIPHNLKIVFCLIIILVSINFIIFYNKAKYKWPFFEIITLFISMLIGISTVLIHDDTRLSSHYVHFNNQNEKTSFFNLTITEKLKKSSSKNRYVATINSLNSKTATGKVILNIADSTHDDLIDVGTNINVFGLLYKNKKSQNPGQFNYADYLQKKQIYAQIFSNYNDCQIEKTPSKSLNYYAGRLRSKIIKNLQENNFNQTELNVVVALLLGQQQEISPEILKDYQLAGAIHVLSVSGLHVGFILLFVTWLLSPISNTKKGLRFKLIITLLSLWMFGILAGLAPCVLRSVTMFSFLAIGNFMRRSVNIYHTLLVSMLLILLVEPSFLFDVGFQLSYSALFFIVWLQPLLSAVYVPKSKVVSYFWDIVTVSFAAQIGTFPLSIYYFHQFPGLFFVTNLIILPALTVILALGLVVIIMASLDISWGFLIQLLENLIHVLNQVIKKIASFEDFIFKNIALSFVMMLGLYITLICWIIFCKKPTITKFYLGLLSIISLQIICFRQKHITQKTSEFVVLSIKKNSLLLEKIGTTARVYANDSILQNIQKNNTLTSYAIENFIDSTAKKPMQNLYYFKNQKILVIDSTTVLSDEKPDVIILTNSPKINLERLFINYKPNIIIADKSNYKSYVKIWRQNCEKHKVVFHDVSNQGFFKL